MNIYILTEEKPKTSVIEQILTQAKKDFKINISHMSQIKINPLIKNGNFLFSYYVEGIQITGIDKIIIKTVTGNSSFFDFLLFKQEHEPKPSNLSDNLLMAIEETKTSDDESRNTGVYQRGSKFAYIKYYYPKAKLYMLYNEELEARENKKPSDTSIFGTNMLLTLNAKIVGKETHRWFHKYTNLDDLIRDKNNMRKPPKGNVPIEINKYNDTITVSGRLAKPANAGNIGHDPNIGALSMISNSIRTLGWNGNIVITKHGISQNYINKTKGKNKFLYICKILNIDLEGIILPKIELPKEYWHYEKSSEKIASILLHIIGEKSNMKEVYQNHAGCERGYFKTKLNKLITLPKKDTNGINLYIPDLVLYDQSSNTVLLIEGKKLSTLNNGISEIEDYDSIEVEYINKLYPNSTVYRYLTIFGGSRTELPNRKILLYVNDSGLVIVNKDAPKFVLDAFRNYNVSFQ